MFGTNVLCICLVRVPFGKGRNIYHLWTKTLNALVKGGEVRAKQKANSYFNAIVLMIEKKILVEKRRALIL